MYITHFEISNYKSYRAATSINLLPGFNIITGQNSAGKTSLLEALALDFFGTPHRSLVTVPEPGINPPFNSTALIKFTVEREELLNVLRSSPGQFCLPDPADTFRFPGNIQFDGSQGTRGRFVQWFLSHAEFEVSVRRSASINSNQSSWEVIDPGMGVYNYRPSPQGTTFSTFHVQPDGVLGAIGATNANLDISLSLWLARTMQPRIYRFFAERFNVGQSGTGSSPVLASHAQNLPEVLSVLQANPQRMLKLNRLLHEILPQVEQVSVSPLGSNTLEIRVWPHNPASQREDLALPLSQCGSGVGQVIAMLYVVLTASHPHVIIIDEPQSLLHPGAVRKLIEVLKAYPQHQYIFATHSPTVITASNPSTVTVAKLEGVETRLQSIDTRQTQDLQLYLADIGARLSDVFGADNILWVEGQTEELAFPLILSRLPNRSLMGTAIIGIKQTGDLEGRDAKRVFELYHRLSGSTAILPPALAFILDRECRSRSLRDDLQRESGGRAHFLARRMFENYLLNPAGIVAVANGIEGFSAALVTQEEVARLIEGKRGDLRYFCPGARVVPADWLVEIDGARVLKEIFGDLSENRVTYDKVRHSVELAKWLISNQPEDLQEVSNLLAALVPASG